MKRFGNWRIKCAWGDVDYRPSRCAAIQGYIRVVIAIRGSGIGLVWLYFFDLLDEDGAMRYHGYNCAKGCQFWRKYGAGHA